jgi:hypothetical protein
VAKRSFTSGCAKAKAISRDKRKVISLGVPAGTADPYQVMKSNSGSPASATEGVSGKESKRLALDTANATNLPDFT